MEPNLARPKANGRTCIQTIPLMLALLIDCAIGHQLEPSSSNEIPHSSSNFSQFPRDVTNLRLSSDFRAIKLGWTYEHSQVNRPAAFKISYCELTSWNAEIKCRHKDMRVDSLVQRAHQEPAPDRNDSSVIQQQVRPIDLVHQVDPPAGANFEAQIHDLRALTNYTFQVQVAHFWGEGVGGAGAARRRSSQLARRLELHGEPAGGERAETKPFGAQAAKCLANVSEVLISTGRYFGGRISVEGSADSRCHLLGNKTSDQSVYLFRIDHQACRSKIVDGNRIESMVLVHENRDILTHNTARFLVLCNFQHESFTVRASVSLPKINGLASQPVPGGAPTGRPATITRVKSDTGGEHVRIGSMPGIYRPVRVAPHQQQATSGADLGKIGEPNDANATQASAETTAPPASSIQAGRQSKKLSPSAEVLQHQHQHQHRQQARSLTLASELVGSLLPAPVDVSSKLLTVEPAPGADPVRSAKLLQPKSRHQLHPARQLAAGQQRQPSNDSVLPAVGAISWSLPTEAAGGQPTVGGQWLAAGPDSGKPAGWPRITPAAGQQRTGADNRHYHADDEIGDGQQGPIIVTNNHRVAGNYLTLSQAAEAAPAANTGQQPADDAASFSIKYSAAQVHEYAVGKLDQQLAMAPSRYVDALASSAPRQAPAARSRSGRMRVVTGGPEPAAHHHPTMATLDGAGLVVSKARNLESRMGDMPGDSATPTDLLVAESGAPASEQPAEPPSAGANRSRLAAETLAAGPTGASQTLAHNITGALLRWSLRALGNLARKSLESLVVESDNFNQTVGGDASARHLELPTGTTLGSARLDGAQSAATLAAVLAPPHQELQLTEPSRLKAPKVAPTKPDQALVAANTRASEQELDGFMVTTSASRASTELAHQRTRQPGPDEHPKDADQTAHKDQQSDSGGERPTTRRPLTSVHVRHQRPASVAPPREQLSRAKATDESASKNDEPAGAPAWPIYGLWALIALVVLASVTIYLVFAPSLGWRKCDQNGNHLQRRILGRIGAHTGCLSGQPSGLTDASNGSSGSLINERDRLAHASAPHHHTTAPVANSLFSASARGHQPESHVGSSSGSQSTRSTSAASSLGRENYCKNNEFVYTDHVLINAFGGPNESFA